MGPKTVFGESDLEWYNRADQMLRHSNTAPTTRIGPPSTEARRRWRSLGQLARVLFKTGCVIKSSTFRTYFYENSAMLDYDCGGQPTQNGSTLKRVSRLTQYQLERYTSNSFQGHTHCPYCALSRSTTVEDGATVHHRTRSRRRLLT
jgi:hypothetical protein